MPRTKNGLPGIYNSASITLTDGEGTALSTNVNGVVNVAVVSGGSSTAQGTYNTSAPTLTNGAVNSVQLDVNANLKVVEQYAAVAEDNTSGVIAGAIKPLATSTYSWTRFVDFGSNVTLNVKASAGNIKSIYCHNLNAAVRYIQIHNTATTPGAAAVPLYSFLVNNAAATIIDGQFFGENGANFTTGIAFAFSTTEGTYTAGSAGDQATIIMYK